MLHEHPTLEHGAMNPWITLGAAITAEVIATSALKASEGFTRLLPSIIVVLGYGVAFWLLSITLRSIPVGVAYGIWSGLGTVLIAVVGWVVFGQKLDAWALLGMGLIVAGVLIMNLLSKSAAH
jgi:multidrug transporter EmrE-like cation transporter